MKKSLVALAALAASTAFAQSSVTISGTLEIAPVSGGKATTQAASSSTAVAQSNSRTSGANTWSTSIINISGTEDMGQGLKASFVLISGAGAGAGAHGVGSAAAADTGIGNRERTLALQGGFGTLRFGRFVPAPSAGFHSHSGSGSATLVGSSYALSTSSTTASPNAMHTSGTMFERQDNVLQYTSPTANGASFNLYVADSKSDSDAAALLGRTATQQTGLSVTYAAGPLSLGLGVNNNKGNVELVAEVTAASGSAGTAAVANSSSKATLNWLGVSYDLGMATVHAHYVTRDGTATTAAGVTTTGTDIKVSGLGLTVPVGAVTLRASMHTGTDKRGVGVTDDMKLTGHQLSAAYALSKRTSLVVATGQNQFKRDGAASTAATRKVQGSTLALNHTF